jgi:hypothetical protein
MGRDPALYPRIRFEIADRRLARAIRALPWDAPIESWRERGIPHLPVRRGIGRHPLIFVEADGHALVIKELGVDGARREIAVYRRLRELGIEAWSRQAWWCGKRRRPDRDLRRAQRTENAVGHSVTRLADRVLPTRFSFASVSPRQPAPHPDAELDLFVDLHMNGIYWGDASMANTLIRFHKENIPYVGRHTRLHAVLADAETVEMRGALSDALRRADVETFIDSMHWMHEDLRLAGIFRDPHATEEDTAFFFGEYERRCAIAVEERAFRERTGLDVRRMLGRVRDRAYLETLLRHIEEHKWYLSESVEREVPLHEAAVRWRTEVFAPVCALFRKQKVLELFPGKTASDLYVEVMTHKYYLSREKGEDVGMVEALRDYAERFGQKPLLAAFWNRLARSLVRVLGVREAFRLGVVT